jgi:hypothetical protein
MASGRSGRGRTAPATSTRPLAADLSLGRGRRRGAACNQPSLASSSWSSYRFARREVRGLHRAAAENAK